MESHWRAVLNSVGLLILRIGFGAYMAIHGWGKVDMVINGRFEQFADPLGIGKTPSLILAMSAEFICAILVILGLATRFAAAPIVVAMGVAAFIVHQHDPWTMGEAAKLFMAGDTKFPVSKEPALLFFTVFLGLAFTGAGRFSLDGIITVWWRQRQR